MTPSPADAQQRGLEQLEFVRPTPLHLTALRSFFEEMSGSEEASWFHPHPFTPEAALERVQYGGPDYYCLGIAGRRVLAYGMLRGWAEGYAVPSLGIAVRREARGLGIGQAMMAVLHAEARRRGAKSVRLKVYPENERAVELYRSLGYAYGAERVDGQLVGIKDLVERAHSTGRP
jgi:ribosomal-protein-alanine N-acetyltransferase